MIRRLGYYCRKILPTVLDDALSYYEQLCKVLLKCNEVIDVVNGVVESVDNLERNVESNALELGNLSGTVEALGRGLDAVDAETRRVAVLAQNALPKTTTPGVLYGTDGAGQKEYPLANGPVGFTVGLRDAGGVMRVGTPVQDYDAVNLKYFRENSGGSSAEMVLKKVRISAPSGSGTVSIDVSDLDGIVDGTPIFVLYQMPNGEFSGPPSWGVALGGTQLNNGSFGGITGTPVAEMFTTSYPTAFSGWYAKGLLHMYYTQYGDSVIAHGETLDIWAYGNTITSVAYADVIYYKEG